MATVSENCPPLRRRDAEANRQCILAAAAEAFRSEGPAVSMVEIARRAGVGNATVHRNFDSKEQLLDEVFQQWFEQRRAAAQGALVNPDPWLGLVGFLEDSLVEAAGNRALTQLFAVRMSYGELFQRVAVKLVKRAQAAGTIRPDVTGQDLVLQVAGIARTMDLTRDTSPEQWRRQLALALAGLRDDTHGRLPGRAMSSAALEEALRRGGGPSVESDQ
jgi:AcrR family transcriptional regulator